jgi:serine/threonine-protein kinase
LTLQVPTGWELRDASLPDEIVLIWRDPTTTGGVLVSVFADPNSYTAAELGGLLERYLVRSYRDLPAFNAGAAVNSNNRMHVDWSYTATQRSLVIPLSGISQIFQHNEQIVIISVVIPTAQRETLAAQVNAILASVQISEQPTTP